MLKSVALKNFFKTSTFILTLFAAASTANSQEAVGTWSATGTGAQVDLSGPSMSFACDEDGEIEVLINHAIEDSIYAPMLGTEAVKVGWFFLSSRDQFVSGEEAGVPWGFGIEVRQGLWFIAPIEAAGRKNLVKALSEHSQAILILAGERAEGATTLDEIIEKSTVFNISLRGSRRALSDGLAGCST